MTATPLPPPRIKAPLLSNLTAPPSVFRPSETTHIVLAGIVLCFVATFAFFGYLSAGLVRPTAAQPRQSPPVRAATGRPAVATGQSSSWDIVIDPDPTQFLAGEDEGEASWTQP
jgi:hypothetical protein